MPQVSVVIPAKDVASYIAPILTDLEAQIFGDLEVIVVDDGSTDETPQIIESFVGRDSRFKLLTSGGAGVSNARNVGIDHASGEFLAFVDADDRVSTHYIQKLHETITETGSDIVSCNVQRLEGYRTSPSLLHQRACTKAQTKTHISRSPRLVWDTTVWNKLWRRSMWERAGIRYAEGRWLNDFFPCIRGHVASKSVDMITDVLYYWQIRTDPTTSITDSRLTDPVARLKSFGDRMFAIHSARRMVAEDAPKPRLIEAFDYRILRSDLPIYLPYYHGSDEQYQELLMDRIGTFLTEFGIRPADFSLGSQLQLVYGAILARDHDRLGALLHPETQIHPSSRRRQRTELLLAGVGNDAPLQRRSSTPHGPLGRRAAQLARAARLRQLDLTPVNATVQIDRVESDPAWPATLVIQGAVRLREGRSSVTGDWTVSACLESTRKSRGTGRLTGRLTPVAKLIEEVRGPRARVIGEATPLERPPDEALHPLARSGWQPFAARVDLSKTQGFAADPEWRLAVHLHSGKMDLFPTVKLTPEATQHLPGGFNAGTDTALIPVVRGGNRVVLRKESVRAQVRHATVEGEDLLVSVGISSHDSESGSHLLWLQTPDRKARTPEVRVIDGTAKLALPDVDDSSTRYEVWCRTPSGTSRARAHPGLRTARLAHPKLEGRREVVLRPTAQGRVVVESRPAQLDLSWLRADEAPSFLLLGGEGEPSSISRSTLNLVLACPWSGEQIDVPLSSHPDGWQAAVDVGPLTGPNGEPRSWLLLASKSAGGKVPLRIPVERRAALPIRDTVGGTPVQLRIDGQGSPVLWIGAEPELERWKKLRKVRRSRAASTAADVSNNGDGDSDPDTGRSTEPAGDGRQRPEEEAFEAALNTPTQPVPPPDRDLALVLSRLTAPQASRSMTKVGAPSFREKVDERIRRRRFLLRYTDLTPITEPLINKPMRDRILSMLGFPVPGKLLDSGNLDDVFKVLQEHEEAVIKPVSGATGKGVLLVRRSANGWLNLRTEAELTTEELRTKLESTVAKRKPVKDWQIEQLVVGDANASGQPMDIKFYMFQGEHGLTVQMSRLPRRTVYKFYDRTWQTLDVGRDQDRIDNSLPVPEDPRPLLDLAVGVSEALPLPFLRVDLLLGRDGLYVGEVTPMPGRYHRFSDAVDQELGLLWEMAEFRYGPRFLTSEKFRPALQAIQEVSGYQNLYPD